MESEACSFVGELMDRIKLNLPYILGNDTSYHYLALKFIAKHIHNKQRNNHEYIHFVNFDEGLSAVSTSLQQTVYITYDRHRNGIIDFITRLRECIAFVKDVQNRPMLGYICREIESRRFRESTEDARWTMCIHEWNNALKKWMAYMQMYDSVYPQILWDVPAGLAHIVSTYRREFWIQFWNLFLQSSNNIVTDFEHLLIHTVAPDLIDFSGNNRLCVETLQAFIEGLKRFENFDRFLANYLEKASTCQALIATGITMIPNPDSFGSETTSAMQDVGSFHGPCVRYP